MIIHGRWLSRVAKRFKIPRPKKKKKEKDAMTTLQLQGGINAFAAVGIDRDE